MEYRCPACNYVGEPLYLPKRPKHILGKDDRSSFPLCPYCTNEAAWRNSTQMVPK